MCFPGVQELEPSSSFVVILTRHAVPRIDFGERAGSGLVIPALWVALWNSFLQLGAGSGSFVAGSFQDRFGRRATVFVGGLLGCIGAAVSYISCYPDSMLDRRISFMFAKFILGISCAFLMTSCQTWISETTPRDLRGVFLGFYGFNVVSSYAIIIATFAPANYALTCAGIRPLDRHRRCVWSVDRRQPRLVPNSICFAVGLWWLGYGRGLDPPREPRLAGKPRSD